MKETAPAPPATSPAAHPLAADAIDCEGAMWIIELVRDPALPSGAPDGEAVVWRVYRELPGGGIPVRAWLCFPDGPAGAIPTPVLRTARALRAGYLGGKPSAGTARPGVTKPEGAARPSDTSPRRPPNNLHDQMALF